MKLESVVQIDAPPDVVWRVTTDVERWPEWTPTMHLVKRLDDQPFGVGSAALIKQPGIPEARWVVTSLTSGERFTWETAILGMRLVATHELSPEGTGTRNLLRVEVTGWAARLLWPFIRRSIRTALHTENAGFKAQSELLANDSAGDRHERSG